MTIRCSHEGWWFVEGKDWTCGPFATAESAQHWLDWLEEQQAKSDTAIKLDGT